jgi:intracellular sulfur oxidation DsrE/DsrF family protein
MIKSIAIFLMLLGAVQAQEYKAVFDCSSDDARFILSRMNLIELTAKMIEKRGDQTSFAITLHGGCVPMVSKEFREVVWDEDAIYIQKAQETITRLSKRKDFEIVACAMSLENNGLEQEDVLPFVRISPNSFIDTIGYQNDGYALMTFK